MFYKNCVFVNLLLMTILKVVFFLFLSFSSLWSNSEFDVLFRNYNFKLGDTESDFLKNNFNVTKSQTLIVQKQVLVLPNEMKIYSISKSNSSNTLEKNPSLNQMITDMVVYFYQDRLAIISALYEGFSSINEIVSIMNKNFGKPNYYRRFFLESGEGNTVYKWKKTSATSLLDYTVGLGKATLFVFDNQIQEQIEEKINPPKIVEKVITITKKKKLTEEQCKKYYNLTIKYEKRNKKYKSRINRYNKKEKRFQRAAKKTKSQDKRKRYSDKAKRYKKRVKRYKKRIIKYEKRIKRYKKRLKSCKITQA